MSGGDADKENPMPSTRQFPYNDGSVLVIFGFDHGDEFQVAHGKPSRTYRTAKGAAKSAAAWVAAERARL
jgi:hypothetical protein